MNPKKIPTKGAISVTNPVRKRNAMKARNDAARIHSLVQLEDKTPRSTECYRLLSLNHTFPGIVPSVAMNSAQRITLFGNEALLGERRLKPLSS